MSDEVQLLKDLGLKRVHGLRSRELLRRLGAAQNGQFGLRQARVVHVKPTEVRALHAAGEITLRRPGVWQFTSAPGYVDPAVTAFLLAWPHAVISHASAAQHHGLTRVAVPALPELTVPHGRTCRPASVVVHHSKSLTSSDILRVGPLRYTTMARTVCDLASADDPWETLSILDDAIAAGAKQRWIHQRAVALNSGRDGLGLIERATLPGASSEFRSWLERAGAHVFHLGGLPAPQWNVGIRDSRGFVGVVDALWLPERVICELKGLRFHTTAAQLRHDDRRQNRLLDAGYAVRAAAWRDLVDDPVGVVRTVMRAMRAAGAEVDLAAVPETITVPTRPFM